MASARLLLQPASCLQEGAVRVRVRRTLPWLLAAVTVDAMAATAHPRLLCRANYSREWLFRAWSCRLAGGVGQEKLSVLDMELEAFVASFKG